LSGTARKGETRQAKAKSAESMAHESLESEMASETVFVTGSTGFIGTALVNELVQRGHSVRALAREASNTDGLAHERISIVRGNIMDRESLVRGMQGCTQVYHLAAYAKNWARDPSTFFRLNVDGTKNVFLAAQDAGVRRIVFTSTIVVFGPTPPGFVGDESMPRMTQTYCTEYEESKTVAEQEALKLAACGLPVVVVNPTRVYGPGKLTEGNSLSLMLDRYQRGKFPILLNKGKNVGNYVLVDDLVRGHILAMEKGRFGERYILGGENVSLKGLFTIVDELTRERHRHINLPPRFAMLYSALERKKAEWFGLYPQITPGWVQTFLQDWAYCSAKAESELGYQITPLREGIRRTLDWIRKTKEKQ
jgi:nucleoside-diphosphate-sugar epimerase